jgi:hypothetical protein
VATKIEKLKQSEATAKTNPAKTSCDPTDLLEEMDAMITMKKPKQSQAIAKQDAAKEPETVKATATEDPAPAKTPFVTVDMANFENHKLPKVLPDNLVAYTNNLPMDELVVDVMLIGKNFKSFKDWFHKHAEFVGSLRDRLPQRGPNAIRIKRGGKIQVFTWSEFCLEFFGVSSEWVRRQLLLSEGMKADPQMVAPAKKKKNKPDSADTAVVSKLSWETLEHKAAKSEVRYVSTMAELWSLIKVVRSTEDRAKQLQYVNDLEKRLAALDLEPPAAGSKMNLLLDELEKKAKAAGEEL